MTLNVLFKKMARKPEPVWTKESLERVLEEATIQQKLYLKDIEIIYIDEFSVNTRHYQFYGWSKRGRRGLVRIQNNDFCMSFIWAVSNIKVSGIIGNQGSNKSKEFKFYLRELIESRRANPELEKVLLIMMYNNARIHTFNEL